MSVTPKVLLVVSPEAQTSVLVLDTKSMPATAVLPLATLYYHGSTWTLAIVFFLGWALVGLFPLFMSTIPSESVSPAHMTTAMALIMGLGEVLGGVLAPWLAGRVADQAGLAAPLWIMLGLCLTAGTLGLALVETAPSRVGAAR